MEKYTVKKYLDAKGLTCPEPVMLLHKAVREVAPGDYVEVVATDPSTRRDVPNFCEFLGHELVLQDECDGTYVFHIRKGGL